MDIAAWFHNPWAWALVSLPLLVLRPRIQRRLGTISGSRRSVVLSGACFVGTFGVLNCLPHSSGLGVRGGLALGLFLASTAFDWFASKPRSQERR